jgi:hypothetical protein
MPNCKVDDMVLIIKARVTNNIGVHATIIASAGWYEGERLWVCESPTPIMTRNLDPQDPFRVEWHTRFLALDSWLIPIKGPSVDDKQFEGEEDDVGSGVVHHQSCEVV